MKNVLFCLLVLAPPFAATAQVPSAGAARLSTAPEILLWPAGAPGSEGKTAPEKVRIAETGDHVVSSIHRPSITAFLPGHGTGAAVIIAPGGGHSELWIDHEGYNPAKYFQSKGIAAFVLKYRLAREQGSTYTVDKEEVADIQRAIRLVRSRAKEWGIDTGRLGVMGFSAGGELAALAAMRFDSVQTSPADAIDRLSARPDFQALIYPGNSHRFHVAPNAPPVFIVAGFKDRPDISEGAAEVYLQYKRAGVPAELHIYEAVGHGFGMRPTNTGAVTGWPDRFIEWLREIGQLDAPSPGHAAATGTPAPPPGHALTVPLGDGLSLSLSWIPPGTFTLGSPDSEPGRKSDEGPQTQVTLSRGYWLGQTEVTIAQWRAVMNESLRDHVAKMLKDETVYDFGNGHKATLRAFMHFDPDNPDKLLLGDDDNTPMYFVSWDDAMDFCRRLTASARAAGALPEGYAYTLPSEAQWEYACRAGTTTPTFAGNANAGIMDNIAWYGHAHGGPSPVGEKEANAWGLGDMPGNLWEWCRDWYGPYPGGNLTDPAGPATGAGRVNRGGSWGSGLSDERSATRASNPQPEKSAYRGFRVALCAITPAI
ncbi:MAG TPA: SUMF1/EgtB/PvdO family nonheme iron enzyme [Dinghuibacter sp.]|jgi:endo-1,4-beta-xylanase|uniref:SUMF1/EgtB/PvdO family nonheme iron enzyme n=1 Tax=Dinghuibacter sp. TaxID=2024697 RepID=UPI002C84DF19|nr:SUMF1/EgtB/PvdO family nonheme iron enzyme [Dinghuibacter sp.]HTJ10466.1 SUMF1/EgtB/PvdO family nonheme iron enzyme [Dinghuibacter sp.]